LEPGLGTRRRIPGEVGGSEISERTFGEILEMVKIERLEREP
jgi:hypothetical protein